MNKFYNGKRVWITGHNGMVGSSLVRELSKFNCKLLLASKNELNLLDGISVRKWVLFNKPDYVFHVAARVGGIVANIKYPAEFLIENLQSTINVISSSKEVEVKKLIFVATNCTYSKSLSTPIPEESLFTGIPDESVRSYAVSKISGIEMCRAFNKQYSCNFLSVIPPNLFGIGDNYHQENSHVLAGIIQKTHFAKINKLPNLIIWGDGTPRRELLWVDDLARAMAMLMFQNTKYDLYNIGSGVDMSILEIANMVKSVVGYEGTIMFDRTKPNGVKCKLLDNSRITKIGWKAEITIIDGIRMAYNDYISNNNLRK